MTPEQVKDKLSERETLTGKQASIERAIGVEAPTITVTIAGKAADGSAVKEVVNLTDYWPLIKNMLEDVSAEQTSSIAEIESLFSQL